MTPASYATARLDSGADPAQVAAEIAADPDLCHILARQAVAEAQRRHVRHIEQATDPNVLTAAATQTPTDRAALLAESFAVGDGRFVTWGQATVDDHKARIAFLTSLRDGIDATIDRHRQAVDTIVAADVACLDDLQAVPA